MGFINSVIVLVLPFFVKFLAPDNTPDQWARIFYIISAVIFVALMIFNFTCKAEPRKWAYSKNLVSNGMPLESRPSHNGEEA